MASVVGSTRLVFLILDVLLGVVFVVTNTDFCGSAFESHYGK